MYNPLIQMMISAEKRNPAQHEAEWFKQMIAEKRVQQKRRDAQASVTPAEELRSDQREAEDFKQLLCEKCAAHRARLGARFSRWFGRLLINTGKRMLPHAHS
jgi:hypothetical protein